MKTYTLTVITKRLETEDTVTLSFKQPGLKKIAYLAGQYLTLIFKINGRRYSRPYSFSSAPNVDKFLEVTVKRIPGGTVSNHIFDIVKEGDVVEVLEPIGDFVIPVDASYSGYPIILWGAGSGITPLFSIIKQILHSGHQQIILVYGNRALDSVIFKHQIEVLQEQYSNRFFVWNFYTQIEKVDRTDRLFVGRVAPNLVLETLSEKFDLSASLHYICGPAGLKVSVKETLDKYFVPSNQVFSEDFELVKNEADFVDVSTELVTIVYNGKSQQIEVAKGKSILEAGLDALIDMPYSCQTGNCSVCKGKLLAGSVKQILPKHGNLSDDEFQLCCTYPKSTDVVFEI